MCFFKIKVKKIFFHVRKYERTQVESIIESKWQWQYHYYWYCHCHWTLFFFTNLWWNQLCKLLGWYNSLHFVTITLVSPQNDIWGTSTEMPYGCMMCHYPYLGGASKWLKEISLAAWTIRNTTQIWYRISLLAPQTSFCGKTSGGIMKYQLFTHAGKS